MKAYAKGNTHVLFELEKMETGTTIHQTFSILKDRFPYIMMETATLMNAVKQDTRDVIVDIVNGANKPEAAEHAEVEQAHAVDETESTASEPSSLKPKVVNPDYYAWFKDKHGIELIDILSEMPFDLGNAVKYVMRNGKKVDGGSAAESAIKDLNKSITYIKHYIERVLGGECIYTDGNQ